MAELQPLLWLLGGQVTMYQPGSRSQNRKDLVLNACKTSVQTVNQLIPILNMGIEKAEHFRGNPI